MHDGDVICGHFWSFMDLSPSESVVIKSCLMLYYHRVLKMSLVVRVTL